jgi:hypothetical protein
MARKSCASIAQCFARISVETQSRMRLQCTTSGRIAWLAAAASVAGVFSYWREPRGQRFAQGCQRDLRPTRDRFSRIEQRQIKRARRQSNQSPDHDAEEACRRQRRVLRLDSRSLATVRCNDHWQLAKHPIPSGKPVRATCALQNFLQNWRRKPHGLE